MMGDTIIKGNSYRIRSVEALQRICILSDGLLTLEIIREEVPMKIEVKIDWFFFNYWKDKPWLLIYIK